MCIHLLEIETTDSSLILSSYNGLIFNGLCFVFCKLFKYSKSWKFCLLDSDFVRCDVGSKPSFVIKRNISSDMLLDLLSSSYRIKDIISFCLFLKINQSYRIDCWHPTDHQCGQYGHYKGEKKRKTIRENIRKSNKDDRRKHLPSSSLPFFFFFFKA